MILYIGTIFRARTMIVRFNLEDVKQNKFRFFYFTLWLIGLL